MQAPAAGKAPAGKAPEGKAPEGKAPAGKTPGGKAGTVSKFSRRSSCCSPCAPACTSKRRLHCCATDTFAASWAVLHGTPSPSRRLPLWRRVPAVQPGTAHRHREPGARLAASPRPPSFAISLRHPARAAVSGAASPSLQGLPRPSPPCRSPARSPRPHLRPRPLPAPNPRRPRLLRRPPSRSQCPRLHPHRPRSQCPRLHPRRRPRESPRAVRMLQAPVERPSYACSRTQALDFASMLRLLRPAISCPPVLCSPPPPSPTPPVRQCACFLPRLPGSGAVLPVQCSSPEHCQARAAGCLQF